MCTYLRTDGRLVCLCRVVPVKINTCVLPLLLLAWAMLSITQGGNLVGREITCRSIILAAYYYDDNIRLVD